MLLSVVGICAYSAATAYVLGFAIWRRKDIIQFPSHHSASVVQSTYKAFGFLFYGVQTSSGDCVSLRVCRLRAKVFLLGDDRSHSKAVGAHYQYLVPSCQFYDDTDIGSIFDCTGIAGILQN